MAVYCISYDLAAGRSYEPVITAIKSYGLWWHQSESTWFIETHHTARQIIDHLRANTLAVDKIIVIQVKKNWWSVGHREEEYDWMKQRNF